MIKKILIIFLLAFGMLTLFMSSSVLFDWFGIREREGHFVPIVVSANLICGILYLMAAIAILKNKSWAKIPLIIALIILFAAYAMLFNHINEGGLYETKTINAMAFRIAITVTFLLTTLKIIKK